jgi:hypothetical protein
VQKISDWFSPNAHPEDERILHITPHVSKLRFNFVNAFYRSVQNILSFRILSKNLKINIYRTIFFLLFCMSVKLGLSL